jgi:hypothetical protein
VLADDCLTDVSSRPYDKLGEIEDAFNPQPSGSWMEIGTHRVRVDVEHKIDTPRKLYVIDITITSIARLEPAPTLDVSAPPNSSDLFNTVFELMDKASSQRIPRRNASRLHQQGFKGNESRNW